MWLLMFLQTQVFLLGKNAGFFKRISFQSYLFCFQGGRELSDFISYLQREATNSPVIQEEKPKKKKKAQEDL